MVKDDNNIKKKKNIDQAAEKKTRKQKHRFEGKIIENDLKEIKTSIEDEQVNSLLNSQDTKELLVDQATVNVLKVRESVKNKIKLNSKFNISRPEENKKKLSIRKRSFKTNDQEPIPRKRFKKETQLNSDAEALTSFIASEQLEANEKKEIIFDVHDRRSRSENISFCEFNETIEQKSIKKPMVSTTKKKSTVSRRPLNSFTVKNIAQRDKLKKKLIKEELICGNNNLVEAAVLEESDENSLVISTVSMENEQSLQTSKKTNSYLDGTELTSAMETIEQEILPMVQQGFVVEAKTSNNDCASGDIEKHNIRPHRFDEGFFNNQESVGSNCLEAELPNHKLISEDKYIEVDSFKETSKYNKGFLNVDGVNTDYVFKQKNIIEQFQVTDEPANPDVIDEEGSGFQKDDFLYREHVSTGSKGEYSNSKEYDTQSINEIVVNGHTSQLLPESDIDTEKTSVFDRERQIQNSNKEQFESASGAKYHTDTVETSVFDRERQIQNSNREQFESASGAKYHTDTEKNSVFDRERQIQNSNKVQCQSDSGVKDHIDTENKEERIFNGELKIENSENIFLRRKFEKLIKNDFYVKLNFNHKEKNEENEKINKRDKRDIKFKRNKRNMKFKRNIKDKEKVSLFTTQLKQFVNWFSNFITGKEVFKAKINGILQEKSKKRKRNSDKFIDGEIKLKRYKINTFIKPNPHPDSEIAFLNEIKVKNINDHLQVIPPKVDNDSDEGQIFYDCLKLKEEKVETVSPLLKIKPNDRIKFFTRIYEDLYIKPDDDLCMIQIDGHIDDYVYDKAFEYKAFEKYMPRRIFFNGLNVIEEPINIYCVDGNRFIPENKLIEIIENEKKCMRIINKDKGGKLEREIENEEKCMRIKEKGKVGKLDKEIENEKKCMRIMDKELNTEDIDKNQDKLIENEEKCMRIMDEVKGRKLDEELDKESCMYESKGNFMINNNASLDNTVTITKNRYNGSKASDISGNKPENSELKEFKMTYDSIPKHEIYTKICMKMPKISDYDEVTVKEIVSIFTTQEPDKLTEFTKRQFEDIEDDEKMMINPSKKSKFDNYNEVTKKRIQTEDDFIAIIDPSKKSKFDNSSMYNSNVYGNSKNVFNRVNSNNDKRFKKKETSDENVYTIEGTRLNEESQSQGYTPKYKESKQFLKHCKDAGQSSTSMYSKYAEGRAEIPFELPLWEVNDSDDEKFDFNIKLLLYGFSQKSKKNIYKGTSIKDPERNYYLSLVKPEKREQWIRDLNDTGDSDSETTNTKDLGIIGKQNDQKKIQINQTKTQSNSSEKFQQEKSCKNDMNVNLTNVLQTNVKYNQHEKNDIKSGNNSNINTNSALETNRDKENEEDIDKVTMFHNNSEIKSNNPLASTPIAKEHTNIESVLKETTKDTSKVKIIETHTLEKNDLVNNETNQAFNTHNQDSFLITDSKSKDNSDSIKKSLKEKSNKRTFNDCDSLSTFVSKESIFNSNSIVNDLDSKNIELKTVIQKENENSIAIKESINQNEDNNQIIVKKKKVTFKDEPIIIMYQETNKGSYYKENSSKNRQSEDNKNNSLEINSMNENNHKDPTTTQITSVGTDQQNYTTVNQSSSNINVPKNDKNIHSITMPSNNQENITFRHNLNEPTTTNPLTNINDFTITNESTKNDVILFANNQPKMQNPLVSTQNYQTEHSSSNFPFSNIQNSIENDNIKTKNIFEREQNKTIESALNTFRVHSNLGSPEVHTDFSKSNTIFHSQKRPATSYTDNSNTNLSHFAKEMNLKNNPIPEKQNNFVGFSNFPANNQTSFNPTSNSFLNISNSQQPSVTPSQDQKPKNIPDFLKIKPTAQSVNNNNNTNPFMMDSNIIDDKLDNSNFFQNNQPTTQGFNEGSISNGSLWPVSNSNNNNSSGFSGLSFLNADDRKMFFENNEDDMPPVSNNEFFNSNVNNLKNLTNTFNNNQNTFQDTNLNFGNNSFILKAQENVNSFNNQANFNPNSFQPTNNIQGHNTATQTPLWNSYFDQSSQSIKSENIETKTINPSLSTHPNFLNLGLAGQNNNSSNPQPSFEFKFNQNGQQENNLSRTQSLEKTPTNVFNSFGNQGTVLKNSSFDSGNYANSANNQQTNLLNVSSTDGITRSSSFGGTFNPEFNTNTPSNPFAKNMNPQNNQNNSFLNANATNSFNPPTQSSTSLTNPTSNIFGDTNIPSFLNTLPTQNRSPQELQNNCFPNNSVPNFLTTPVQQNHTLTTSQNNAFAPNFSVNQQLNNANLPTPQNNPFIKSNIPCFLNTLPQNTSNVFSQPTTKNTYNDLTQEFANKSHMNNNFQFYQLNNALAPDFGNQPQTNNSLFSYTPSNSNEPIYDSFPANLNIAQSNRNNFDTSQSNPSFNLLNDQQNIIDSNSATTQRYNNTGPQMNSFGQFRSSILGAHANHEDTMKNINTFDNIKNNNATFKTNTNYSGSMNNTNENQKIGFGGIRESFQDNNQSEGISYLHNSNQLLYQPGKEIFSNTVSDQHPISNNEFNNFMNNQNSGISLTPGYNSQANNVNFNNSLNNNNSGFNSSNNYNQTSNNHIEQNSMFANLEKDVGIFGNNANYVTNNDHKQNTGIHSTGFNTLKSVDNQNYNFLNPKQTNLNANFLNISGSNSLAGIHQNNVNNTANNNSFGFMNNQQNSTTHNMNPNYFNPLSNFNRSDNTNPSAQNQTTNNQLGLNSWSGNKNGGFSNDFMNNNFGNMNNTQKDNTNNQSTQYMGNNPFQNNNMQNK